MERKTGRIGRSNYQRLDAMIAEGLSAVQIGEALSVFPETVRKYARRRGVEMVHHFSDPTRHPSWAGGETVDKDGYVLVRVERDGPHGYLIRSARRDDPRGYALKQRVVMHDHLGRQLLPDEVVHHRDDDKSNNDPSNLQVYQSNADHLRETLKGKRPKWTPEGFARIRGRPKGSRSKAAPPSAIADHPKTDDPA